MGSFLVVFEGDLVLELIQVDFTTAVLIQEMGH
jgi:hypothetical protein